MISKQKNSNSFFKKSWVHSIGSFILLQIIFILLELTGWIPRLKDIDGKLFGKIVDSPVFTEWFTFYETPHFNVFTVFLGIVLLSHGIIGAIKELFSRKSSSI